MIVSDIKFNPIALHSLKRWTPQYNKLCIVFGLTYVIGVRSALGNLTVRTVSILMMMTVWLT